jgi:hypothetical protein
VAATLGQIVREARMAGLDVSPETLAVLAELSKRSDASPRISGFSRSLGRSGDAAK